MSWHQEGDPIDGHRFDCVARRFAASASRRRLLAGLLGGAGAGLVTRPDRAAKAQPIPCTTAPCPSGECCGGFCVDVTSDPANCGACGEVCTAAAPTCSGGTCVCQVDCDPPEVPDPATCSCVCDIACCAPSVPDLVACRCVCPVGTIDCGGACVETCCDVANCGACGNTCRPGETCFEGVCGCPSGGDYCPEGQACCDPPTPTCCGDACVDLTTDPSNCGACGDTCGGGRCVDGACTPMDTPTPVALTPEPPVDPLRQQIADASTASLQGLPAPSEYEKHPNDDVRIFVTQARLLLEEGTTATGWSDAQLDAFATETGWIGLTSGALAYTTVEGEGEAEADGGDAATFEGSGTECFECAYERSRCLDQQCPGEAGEGFPCTCCISCNLAEIACLIRCVIR